MQRLLSSARRSSHYRAGVPEMALTREEACAIVVEMWNDDTLAVAAVI